MPLLPKLSEADHSPPKAGHQKKGILSDALFLVPVVGLDLPCGAGRLGLHHAPGMLPSALGFESLY